MLRIGITVSSSGHQNPQNSPLVRCNFGDSFGEFLEITLWHP